ncbi:MAG: hypothetical protein ACJATE_000266 [Bacteroidia bacterium]|jgi:hypothetical protein
MVVLPNKVIFVVTMHRFGNDSTFVQMGQRGTEKQTVAQVQVKCSYQR